MGRPRRRRSSPSTCSGTAGAPRQLAGAQLSLSLLAEAVVFALGMRGLAALGFVVKKEMESRKSVGKSEEVEEEGRV